MSPHVQLPQMAIVLDAARFVGGLLFVCGVFCSAVLLTALQPEPDAWDRCARCHHLRMNHVTGGCRACDECNGFVEGKL